MIICKHCLETKPIDAMSCCGESDWVEISEESALPKGYKEWREEFYEPSDFPEIQEIRNAYEY